MGTEDTSSISPSGDPKQGAPPFGALANGDALEAEFSTRGSWFQNKKVIAILDVIKTLIIICGVPVGIYTYATNKIKERREAEWIAYEKMDDRYWTYERLAMDYPSLAVSDVHASNPELAKLAKPREQLTAEERIHERQLMFMLIAMYERAFILYSNQSTELKANQWAGWENGLKRWCKSPAFKEAWRQIGEDFDRQYQAHVNKELSGLTP